MVYVGFAMVITLDTGASVLSQASVAVHVSVTVPIQLAGVVVKVDGFEVPLIRHPPVNPLLYGIVLGGGMESHKTTILPGAVIVGSGAGRTWIVLDTGTNELSQTSVAVQVSITSPPQAPGGGV